MDSNQPQLMTAAQLAESLSTTLDHIYRLSERGAIPTIRLGRKLRFDPTAVVAHLSAEGATST